MCTQEVSLGAKCNSKYSLLRKGEKVTLEIFSNLKVDFLGARKPWKKFICRKF